MFVGGVDSLLVFMWLMLFDISDCAALECCVWLLVEKKKNKKILSQTQI